MGLHVSKKDVICVIKSDLSFMAVKNKERHTEWPDGE